MNLFSVLQRKNFFTIALLVILAFAAVTRLYRLAIPSTYYFDEVYHALTSKLIARNDQRAYEWWNEAVEPDTAVDWLHPPLAKYTQAVSMKMFGENSFGWRFSSAVFGVLVVAATALLAHVSFRRKSITLLATFLVATDGLLLAQSRIAMNDIHVTFFIILTAAVYVWYRKRAKAVRLNTRKTIKYLSIVGILAGLAMGSKWSGIFVLGAVCVFEGIFILAQKHTSIRSWIRTVGIRVCTLLIIPIFIYVLTYSHMFIQGKSLICTGTEVVQGQCSCSQESSVWVKALSQVLPGQQTYFESLEARGGCKRLISHFSELHNQIWWYQTNLKATHPFQSRPWQWVLDLRPVWTYVNYDAGLGKIANIYNAGNPVLFWLGLIVVIILGASLLITIARNISRYLFDEKRRSYHTIPFELTFLLVLYGIVWVPWALSPRIMFFYHYAPAVPILSILIAYAVMRVPVSMKNRMFIGIGVAAVCLLTFFLLFPIFSGYPMSQAYFDTVFSIFPSWR